VVVVSPDSDQPLGGRTLLFFAHCIHQPIFWTGGSTKLATSMDELREFCNRVLGTGPAAELACTEARESGASGRIELLAAAAEACRRQPDGPGTAVVAEGAGRDSLAANVARELHSALGELPERQREVLALRELLRLSHRQIANVMRIDPAAVAPLIARSRLRLRAERRGLAAERPTCPQRERALRVLVCRQDSEPLNADDDSWVVAHIAGCAECGRAHAAMLEASFCYRAWSVDREARRAPDALAARAAG
jgi:sigma-70-like protein